MARSCLGSSRAREGRDGAPLGAQERSPETLGWGGFGAEYEGRQEDWGLHWDPGPWAAQSRYTAASSGGPRGAGIAGVPGRLRVQEGAEIRTPGPVQSGRRTVQAAPPSRRAERAHPAKR